MKLRFVMKAIVYSVVSIVVLMGVALVSLPSIVSYSSKKLLLENEFKDVALDNIDINLFTGEVKLHHFLADKLEQRGASVEDLDLVLKIGSLLNDTVYIDKLDVKGLRIRLQQTEDGTLSIGYDAKPTEEDVAVEEEPDAELSVWTVIADKITFVGTEVQLFNVDGSAHLDLLFDLTLDNVKADTEGNIKFAKLATTNTVFKAQGREVMTHKDLEITNLNMSSESMSIDTIVLNELMVSVLRQQDGTMEMVEVIEKFTLPDPEDSKIIRSAVEVEKSIESGEAQWAINKMEIRGNSIIHLLDNSIEPKLEKHFNIGKFEFGAIDSTKPEQETPFEIALESSKHDKITLGGTASPLMAEPKADLILEIRQFDLPDFSPYMIAATGYAVQTGAVDLDSKTNIAAGQLSSENTVTLRQLETKLVDKEKAAETNGRLQLPLNTALGVLQDGDGNIELKVPVNGALADPNFEVGPAVRLALGKSISTASLAYLKYAIQPWGAALFVGEKIGNYATSVKFEPIIFEPGASELNTDMKKYLGTMGELLTKREKLRIKACPITSDSDKTALKISGDGASEKQKLADISKLRYNVVTNYLVEEVGIESSRILDCLTSEAGAADAKPAVQISL